MAEISNNGAGLQVINLRASSSTTTNSTETLSVDTPSATTVVSDFTRDQAAAETQSVSVNLLEDDDPLALAAVALEEVIPEQELLSDTRLQIELDQDTGRFIYQSVDVDTGEVRRQFPSEELLDILSTFRSVEGLVVDSEA